MRCPGRTASSAEARPAGEQAAGVHLADAGDMRQSVGPARCGSRARSSTQLGDFRIPIADPNAGLAMLRERALRGHQRRVGRAAHRRQGPLEARRQRLAGRFLSFGLGSNRSMMARPAVHEAPDHAGGFRRERGWLGGDRISHAARAAARASASLAKSDQNASAESAAGPHQKIAPRGGKLAMQTSFRLPHFSQHRGTHWN